ncbi:MAG: Calx-beta domain-containing protein [Caulobacteraceae bacterium]
MILYVKPEAEAKWGSMNNLYSAAKKMGDHLKAAASVPNLDLASSLVDFKTTGPAMGALSTLSTGYSLTPSSTTVDENDGSITFTVTRTGDLVAETLFVSTTQTEGFANSGDYSSLLNQGLIFSAGQSSKTFSVNITNNTTLEPDETFGVIVQRNSSDPASTFLDKSTFTIHDDDGAQPTTYSLTPSSTTVDEDDGTITFTVTRSGGTPAETIFVSTTQTEGSSNSGDYTSLLNQALTFSSGQTTKTFSVSITDNLILESNETFGVIIQRNSSDPVSTFLDKSTFTIHDDDAAVTSYSLTPVTTTVGEASGSLTFTVTSRN